MRRWGRTNSAYCRAPRCPRRLVPGLGRCSRNVVASRVGAAAGPVSHADDAFVARGDRYGRAHLRRPGAACDEDPAGVRHSNPSGLPRRSLMMCNPAHVGLFRSAARWLWSPKQRSDDEQWHEAAYGCPVCDHELPALRPGARVAHVLGPFWLPPTREELMAQCPVHGRSPFNDLSKDLAGRGQISPRPSK